MGKGRYINAPFTRAWGDPFPGYPYALMFSIFIFSQHKEQKREEKRSKHAPMGK